MISEPIDTKTRYRQSPETISVFSYRRTFKRLLDIVAVLLLAPVAVPLIAVMGLMVMRDGGSPFYRQRRIGRNGRVFAILKLRTMVIDAEARLARYLEENPEARAEWNSTQKLRKDPRITRTGRLLRKTSLDELPQLWNVFMGDMSLVGPRPMMCSQRSLYPGTAYYNLRPGITGSWQVSERNESEFASRAAYDASYDKNLTLGTDLNILFRTVGVVLRGTGC